MTLKYNNRFSSAERTGRVTPDAFFNAVPINFSSIATASAKSKSVNAPHRYHYCHRRQRNARGRSRPQKIPRGSRFARISVLHFKFPRAKRPVKFDARVYNEHGEWQIANRIDPHRFRREFRPWKTLRDSTCPRRKKKTRRLFRRARNPGSTGGEGAGTTEKRIGRKDRDEQEAEEQKAVCGKRQWINRREQCKLGPTPDQNPELALHSGIPLRPPTPPRIPESAKPP